MLATEKKTFVIKEPRLKNHGSPQRHWDEANQLSKCYILASLNNVLQYTHHQMEIATHFLKNVHQMFGEHFRSLWMRNVYLILNTEMTEGSPFIEHIENDAVHK